MSSKETCANIRRQRDRPTVPIDILHLRVLHAAVVSDSLSLRAADYPRHVTLRVPIGTRDETHKLTLPV
jgi:hypothetical protein